MILGKLKGSNYMKTIFDNSQLAHVWVSQTQKTGSNSNNSMYFKGRVIYSYTEHFPIAKIYHNNNVLYNNSRHLSITSDHIVNVRLVTTHMNRFDVPNILEPTSDENIQHYNQLLWDHFDRLIDSNKVSAIEHKRIENIVKDFELYCKTFNIKDPNLQFDIDSIEEIVDFKIYNYYKVGIETLLQ